MSIQCEFCEKKAIVSGAKFAGDHGEATGPFNLCAECLAFFTETDGPPFGKGMTEIPTRGMKDVCGYVLGSAKKIIQKLEDSVLTEKARRKIVAKEVWGGF